MINNKFLIIVFIIILAIFGVYFLTTNNNTTNINETIKNTTQSPNEPITQKFNNNDSRNGIITNEESTTKINQSSKKTEKKVQISKIQAINLVKNSYSDDEDYKITNINLVKNSTGNYFWIVKVNEIPYGKISFFINAHTGDFVHPLRVGLDKFAESEVSPKKKSSNKILNNKSDGNLISKKQSIQTIKEIESEISENEELGNNTKSSKENKNIVK